MANYFRINDDFAAARAWFLAEPKPTDQSKLDVWAFTSGRKLNFNSSILVPIERPGDILDITFSHWDIPYVQPRIGSLFEAFASGDIQRIAARLENGDEIEILNVLTMLDCFDRGRSSATYKADGTPNMVIDLHIHPEVVGDHHVFRIKGWPGPLIVSELILKQLHRIGATGFVATNVS
jgi:hypothetical protein